MKRVIWCAWAVVALAFLSLSGFASIPRYSGVDDLGLQGAGGTGGLLVFRDYASNQAGFYCFDGRGSVAALASTTNSAVVLAAYEYGPFGEPIRQTGPLALSNPFRFSTQFTDDISGRVKYLYREYDPMIGRWINRDPIGELGGLNIYSSFFNQPNNVFDRNGFGNDYFIPNPYWNMGVQNAPINVQVTLSPVYREEVVLPPQYMSPPGTLIDIPKPHTNYYFTGNYEMDCKCLGTDPFFVYAFLAAGEVASLPVGVYQIGCDIVDAYNPKLSYSERDQAFFRATSAVALFVVLKGKGISAKEVGTKCVAAESGSMAIGRSNIRWVSESATMDEGALAYQSGAAGAREGMAPAIVGPGGNLVKFDGFEGSTLIDRKLSVTTFPKSQWQAFRQSQALQANGFTGRWEVPTQAEANRAIQMF